MTTIETRGKDGQAYYFKYFREDYICPTCKIPKISFPVFFADDSADDSFDFRIAPLNNDIIKTTDMFLDTKRLYQGKGIPERMIIEMQKIFPGHTIISSTNLHGQKTVCNEWRSIPGTKVWERLVLLDLANYDRTRDIFVLKRT